MQNTLLGDKVYYKRANNRRWKGTANVSGQDGQQVLVKHDSHYIRVHSCRLTLEKTPITILSKNESTLETQQHQKQQHTQERQHTAYDKDSEEKTAKQPVRYKPTIFN